MRQNINNSHYLDMKNPRTMTWSMGLQQKLGKDMMITGTYVGSTASNLSYQDDINRPTSAYFTADGRRVAFLCEDVTRIWDTEVTRDIRGVVSP